MTTERPPFQFYTPWTPGFRDVIQGKFTTCLTPNYQSVAIEPDAVLQIFPHTHGDECPAKDCIATAGIEVLAPSEAPFDYLCFWSVIDAGWLIGELLRLLGIPA